MNDSEIILALSEIIAGLQVENAKISGYIGVLVEKLIAVNKEKSYLLKEMEAEQAGDAVKRAKLKEMKRESG
ncbi:hypothetical protein FACS1894216_16340 [Synergistales bacterium]|nr:hypothetical protein FACS1894216_16340 [Synergistales bacterium]